MIEATGRYNKRTLIGLAPLTPKLSIPPDENAIPDKCFFYETNPRSFVRKGCREADRWLMDLLADLAKAESERQNNPPKDDPRGMVLFYRRWMLAYLASAIDRTLYMGEFENMARGWNNWDEENGPEDLDAAVHKNIRDLGITL
jgi:hypothetical protein